MTESLPDHCPGLTWDREQRSRGLTMQTYTVEWTCELRAESAERPHAWLSMSSLRNWRAAACVRSTPIAMRVIGKSSSCVIDPAQVAKAR